jgi:GNAT superfamily N-acetyltransferase
VVSEEITIRQATVADVPDLVRLRRMMFESMGCDDAAQLDGADAAAAAYFAEAIPAGSFHGWLAVASTGMVVSSGGMVIDQHPPGPSNLSGQIGYIMNLVTIPRYRRRGIARRIMQAMLKWLAEQGIQQGALHATEVGRPLYRELGFVDSNEMQLRLEAGG